MAAHLTPLGKFVKWVLVPLVLAATGFFFVGPKIGAAIDKKLPSKSVAGAEGIQAPKPDAVNGPEVDVSVQPKPVQNATANQTDNGQMGTDLQLDTEDIAPPKKVKHRKNHLVSDTQSSNSVPPLADTPAPNPAPEGPDEGGSGGAAGPPPPSG